MTEEKEGTPDTIRTESSASTPGVEQRTRPTAAAYRGPRIASAGRRPRIIKRARWTAVSSAREVGALIRVLRLRAGFTQDETAELLGVSRRWYNELENGRETIRIGMVLDVLNAFGCHMGLGGEGASFSIEELTHVAAVKGSEDQIWHVDFERGLEDPEERPEAVKRGNKRGYLRSGIRVANNKIVQIPKKRPIVPEFASGVAEGAKTAGLKDKKEANEKHETKSATTEVESK